MITVGAVNPQKFAAAKKSGEVLPGVHSPFFAPDREPSLRAGILAETTALLELFQTR
jgi:hypothetical protein